MHLNLFLSDFYLSDTKMVLRSAIRAKKFDNLKLVLLQRDRKITRQLTVQSDLKRILILASNRDHVRLPQLFGQMVKHGRSPAVVIATLEKSLEGKYHAKGYDLKDYEDSFLSLKLGSEAQPLDLCAVCRYYLIEHT